MEFDYSTDHVLENEYVELRPLKMSDVNALQLISNDPIIWEYLLEDGRDEKALKSYVGNAIEQRLHETAYPFLVIDKTNQRVAGTTRLYEINRELGNVKIGHTWYGASFRGTGINESVKYLLFEFVFNQLDGKRIGFGVHEKNWRSISALQSIGCIKEGVLRGFLPDFRDENAGRYNIVLFSILQLEWVNGVRQLLLSKIKITKGD